VSLTDCTLVAQVTIPQGVGLVALTDCALNFAAEGLFAGGGAASGTSNTCPEVPPSVHNDPNVVYDSADPLRRTTATVSCDGGRGAGNEVADATVARACRTDGTWSMANPNCLVCCSSERRLLHLSERRQLQGPYCRRSSPDCGCPESCKICDCSGPNNCNSGHCCDKSC
jgi:hypothetical protein